MFVHPNKHYFHRKFMDSPPWHCRFSFLVLNGSPILGSIVIPSVTHRPANRACSIHMHLQSAFFSILQSSVYRRRGLCFDGRRWNKSRILWSERVAASIPLDWLFKSVRFFFFIIVMICFKLNTTAVRGTTELMCEKFMPLYHFIFREFSLFLSLPLSL